MIQNHLGLENGSNGKISLKCGNPTERTTPTTTMIESSTTYLFSSEANNNKDAVATTTSYVTTTSVDSTLKATSNFHSDKQICNCLFYLLEILK